MTIITKAIRALEAITDLPNALHACVEMAREAEANRASIRASESLESVSHRGPALYHANSQIEELTRKLAISKETRRTVRAVSDDSEAKLAAVETELNREKEARRQRRMVSGVGEAPPLNAKVLFRIENGPVQYGTVPIPYGTAVEWRYLSPEDMP